MGLGQILLYISIALTALAILFAFKPKLTRWLVSGQLIAVTGMLGYLWWAFLANRFDFIYVLHHSSIALPWYYKLSAMWAGDSGSLILWVFAVSIITFYFSIKHSQNRSVLITLLVLQVFLLLSIFFTAPFAMTDKLYRDGQGLNLLLKSFWMLSHPPVIFISYSVLVVPFGYTIGFALDRDWSFSLWRDKVLPWIIASWFLLGLGIALGAIWAYEVIGWGGYWGWDPVENATLIPWILLTCALHALVASKSSKTGRRSSIGYMLASFIAVIIAVFITRSGLMEKVSVHSFTSQSMAIVLSVLLLISVVISLFIYIRLRKRVDADVEPPMLSKAFLVSAGNVVLLLFASIVLVSTLWPIISLLFGRGQALSSRFYSIIAVPVGVIVMAGLVISPVIKWCQTELRPAVKKLIVPIFLGLISMWILYEASIFQPVIIIITLLGVIAISSAIVRAIEISPRRWGSHIAHIGIAVLIIGIVFSSNLVFSQQMNLREGSDFEFIAEKGLRLDEFTIDGQSGDYIATIDFKRIDGEAQSTEIIGRWDSKIGGWVPQPNITRTLALDIIVSPGKPELGILLAPSLGESVEGNGYKLTLISVSDEEIAFKMDYDNISITKSVIANEMGVFNFIELDKGLTIAVDEVGQEYVEFNITDLRPDIGKTVMLPIKFSIKYLVSFVWMGMFLALLGILWELISRSKHTNEHKGDHVST